VYPHRSRTEHQPFSQAPEYDAGRQGSRVSLPNLPTVSDYTNPDVRAPDRFDRPIDSQLRAEHDSTSLNRQLPSTAIALSTQQI